MPVTDDEMYRHLAADYFHHLQWREKLFAGFFVLVAALLVAFYYTHKKDQTGELWFYLGWTIPLAGVVLSVLFFFLERRCQEVLMDRRKIGKSFEQRAACKGLFTSVGRVGRQARRVTHSRVLHVLYLGGAAGFLVLLIIDIGRSQLWRCVVNYLSRGGV